MKKIAIVLLIIIFIISISFWLFINMQHPSASKKPAVAIKISSVLFQICARNDGIHFLVTESLPKHFLRVNFKHVNYLGVDGYHWGHVINLLGLVFAISPNGTGEYDYIVSPYMAIAIPYWLLITGTGLLLIIITPIAGWITTYFRPTKISIVAGVIIILVFILLNVVPFASWHPGSKIQLQSINDLITLTINPLNVHSDIMLVYGFPFSCYKKGYIDSQQVNLYYGASVGWKSYKVMENLCLVIFLTFLIMSIINWFNILISRNSKCQEITIDKTKSVQNEVS